MKWAIASVNLSMSTEVAFLLDRSRPKTNQRIYLRGCCAGRPAQLIFSDPVAVRHRLGVITRDRIGEIATDHGHID